MLNHSPHSPSPGKSGGQRSADATKNVAQAFAFGHPRFAPVLLASPAKATAAFSPWRKHLPSAISASLRFCLPAPAKPPASIFCFLTLTTICLTLALAPTAQADQQIDYSEDIQPLIAQNCLECHGPDKQKGGLRLDIRESAVKEQKSGYTAIVPGDIDESELIHRILTDDPDEVMPPEGGKLGDQDIAKLKKWIEDGAEYKQHWAYRPLDESAPPEVKQKDWVRNPIDRFVLERLEKEGIMPSPEADKPTLIKRLYYDLIGLPPTPQEVDAFIADKAPDAYEKLVGKLLGSKHFGERWGRHWLDKARYADSDGYEKDRPRPNAWHYRDWVIDAVNKDMPMDQFSVEQLAGDMLPDATNNQKLATAFHRQTLTNTEGGTDQEQFRIEAVFDRTETTGTVWLGLTMNCARCHSHKYDAIPQSEYYQMFAFFNNGDEANTNLPVSKQAQEKYVRDKAAHDAQLKAIDDRIAQAKSADGDTFSAWTQKAAERLSSQNPPEYFDLRDIAVKSDVAGIKFAVEKEGAVEVSGENPDAGGVYDLSAAVGKVDAPVTGIRLDALTDKRLPANGPGRAPNGNFVIAEIEVSIAGRKLEFASTVADHSQDGFPVTNLIDGISDGKNGWAIAREMGKPHYAVLSLKEPVTPKEGDKVEVKLVQRYGGKHSLGRFRIRLMTGDFEKQSLPKPIADVLRLASDKRNDKQVDQLRDHFFKSENAETKKLFTERDALAKKAPKEPVVQVRVIAQRGSPRKTQLLERGDFLHPADEVKAAGLSVLPPVSARSTPDGQAEQKLDRLDFANWLMSEENPLSGRVLANQVWEKLFGEGIVRTMNDFGVRGERPTHPRLLDWLAAEYRRLGWSRKKMIETIVTSATYRQASAHREELLDRDATNRWLARQNRFRMEAEIVRDICLSVSGLLSDKVGGPSVFPPMPPEVAALSYANNFKWNTSKGEDRYRRGMYTFFKRTSPHPNLLAFDCPDSNTTNVKRRASNTPIQALTMLNNEVFIEASQAFAKRIQHLQASNDADRMAQALRLCVGRVPGESEVGHFVSLLDKARMYYAENAEAAKQMAGAYVPEGGDPAESAAWVTVARIALNLDELITRE